MAKRVQWVIRVLLATTLLCGEFVYAQHKGISFQAVLKKPDGTYPTVSGLSVTLQVLDPVSHCVLREEVHSGVNISNGYINLVLGASSAATPPGKNPNPVLSITEVMDNATVRTGLNCVDANDNIASSGQTYTPQMSHPRKLRLRALIGSDVVMADFNMRAVAYAVNAENLNGKTASAFVQTSPSITQPNVESIFSRYSALDAILNGTYTGNAATATLAATASALATAPGACPTGQYMNAMTASGAITCGAPSGSVTSVTSANSYLSVATGTSTPVLTVNVGTAANTVAAGDDARFTDSRPPNGTAGGDLSGSYPNPTVAKISGKSVVLTTPAAGEFLKYDGTNFVNATVPADVTKLPLAGGTMSGAIDMGSQNLTNVGFVTMSANKSLHLSNNSSDPSGLVTADKGKIWFNSTTGEIKYWNGSTAQPLGVAGSGLQTFNTQTGTSQTLAIGTSGTAPAWNSASNTHTLNIPMASATSVTAGLLSKTDYDAFTAKLGTSTTFAGDVTGTYGATSVDKIKGKAINAATYAAGQTLRYDGTDWVNSVLNFADLGSKPTTLAGYGITDAQSSTLANGKIFVGNSSNVATAVTMSGDATLSNAGALTLATVPITKGGTGVTSFTGDRVITTSAAGALQATSCALGQVISFTAAGAITCATPAGGSVTSVTSANSYLSVATGTSTPVLTVNVGTAANTVAAGDDARFTDSRAPSGAAGGDLSGTYPNPSVAKIAGKSVVLTTPAAGEVLKYDGTNFVNGSAADATKLPLAGGTMSGAIDMGSQNLTSVGFVTMSANKSLHLSNNASDPSGLVTADKGKMWFNTTTGEIKYWNGSTAQSLGVAGSGLSNFNTQTGTTQTLAIGTSGTAPAWNSASNTHTLNIPMASTASVTAGLLSKTDYDAFTAKLGTATTFSGDVSGAYNATSVDKIKGKTISATTYAAGQTLRYDGTNWVNAALGFADLSSKPTTLAGYGITDAQSSTLANGKIFVGNASNVATAVTMSGDATLSNAGALTLATVPITKGGTGVTSFASDKLVTTSAAGALQTSSCALNEVITFTAGGAITCASVSSLSGSFANGGNSFGAAASLGTNDAYTLKLKTNNSERMTILSDGKVGINNSAPSVQLDIGGAARIIGSSTGTGSSMTVEGTDAGGYSGYAAKTSDGSTLAFGKNGPSNQGGAVYFYINDAVPMVFSNGNKSRLKFDTSGNVGIGGAMATNDGTLTSDVMTVLANGSVGIGTTSPNTALDMTGALTQRGMTAPGVSAAGKGIIYFDSTSNKFKVSQNGAAYVDLVNTSSGGITSLGGLTAGTQTFAIGTSGTAPAFSSATSTHTLNIPMASTASVTAGLLSKTDYDAFTAKLGTSTTFAGDVSGAYNATSVDKIKGKAINATTYAAGQTLRYDGTDWVNSVLNFADLGSKPTTLAGYGITDAQSSTLANGKIFVGNASNVATAVTMSGDATLSNAGALTLATVPVSKGGTGVTSFTGDRVITTSAAGALQASSCGLNQVISFTAAGAINCVDINTLVTGYVNGGNSFGTAATVGTNDANSLSLKTNNANRMTILSDGRVGINNASPAGILDVQGGTAPSGNGQDINIVAQSGFGTGVTNGGNINLNAGIANSTGVPGVVNVNWTGIKLAPGSNSGGDPAAGFTGIFSSGANRIDFGTNGLNRVSILANGNVVVGSLTSLIVGNNFTDAGTNKNGFAMDISGSYIKTNATKRVWVDNSGNVGINQSVPTATLHISGPTPATGNAVPAITAVGGNGGTTDGNGGGFAFTGGAGTGAGNGGGFNVLTGNSTTGTAGGIFLTAGNGNGATGGRIAIDGANYNSGDITIAPGKGDNNASSGKLYLLGATGPANGTGGIVYVTGGPGGSSGGAGGAINITGGLASAGNGSGADVVVNGGAKSGTGSDGNVILSSTRGYVGVGTPTPSARFDIRQSSPGGVAMHIENNGSAYVKFMHPAGGLTYGWNAADAVQYIAKDGVTGRSINASGTFNATGADFAEWVDWSGPKPVMGSVVNYRGSFVVVSSPMTAAFVGNDVKDTEHAVLVAFAGQLPVLVRGVVEQGDLIVGNGDGTGRAVRRSLATAEDASKAVGTAWASSKDPGLKRVNVAIGIGMHGGGRDVASLKSENENLNREVNDLKKRLEKIEALLNSK